MKKKNDKYLKISSHEPLAQIHWYFGWNVLGTRW